MDVDAGSWGIVILFYIAGYWIWYARRAMDASLGGRVPQSVTWVWIAGLVLILFGASHRGDWLQVALTASGAVVGAAYIAKMKANRVFRLWLAGTVVWLVAVGAWYLAFGNPRSMNDDRHYTFLAFFPPLIVGGALIAWRWAMRDNRE